MSAAYALLGWPLGGGQSAAMFGAAFRAAGLDATYADRPTPPEGLGAAVAELRGGLLAGANVTVPHKLAIRPLLDDETALATAVGAVNTVSWTLGGLLGDNTDVAGFRAALADLDPDLDPDLGLGTGRRALVLGAGGAARAAVHVLAEAGYAIRVLSRSVGQGATLVAAVGRRPGAPVLSNGPLDEASLVASAADAHLLVNATPVGGAADPAACPWPADRALPARLAVLDLVAWPPETLLVARARAAGCRARGGRTMLLHQAAESFRLWTGQEPPLAAMRRALEAAG
jgi:shikimate dehydrogenase